MNRNIVKLTGKTGTEYSIVWKDNPPEGAMKEVYFAPDGGYAVALFKNEPTKKVMERIDCLVGMYRKQVFESSGPDAKSYWGKIFCWPYDIVTGKDTAGRNRIGLVMPVYDSRYRFREDHFPVKKGAEKNQLGIFPPIVNITESRPPRLVIGEICWRFPFCWRVVFENFIPWDWRIQIFPIIMY